MDEIRIRKESIYKSISLAIILAISLSALVYSYMNDYYIGTYSIDQLNNIYIYPKQHIEILSYNIAQDKYVFIGLNGFVLNTYIFSNDKNTVITIKASGLDLYVLFIAVVSLFITYKLNKEFLWNSKRIYFILILILIITSNILLFPYVDIAKAPLQDAKIVSLNKPLETKNNIGIIDLLRNNALIYVKSNNSFSIAILQLVSSNYTILALNVKEYTGYINVSNETFVVLIPTKSSISDFNFTYRRVEFVDVGNEVLKALFTLMPSIVLLIGSVFLIVLRKKIIKEAMPQQSG
ncbi:hypothetical protein Smar_1414 [Staphylothermus marinus F1]|uniref:Uncharacterized protein n=1 Tax=Staphylothermus marinus (strain ATCC 43588 / DSM 3639 / JCM 9404 / F1) TaxID=399550 RepID=A3DPE4_STAMF|nr:hypothetical protein [Staphylothermus marinus]ABN70504.1 hypothetical protein Smar_1414 [Staphylothermus marinus F1]